MTWSLLVENDMQLMVHFTSLVSPYDALMTLNKFLSLERRIFVQNCIETLQSDNDIGSVIKARGEFDDAVQAYSRKYLVIKEKTLGQDHVDTAQSCYNNIWVVMKEKGNFDNTLDDRKSLTKITLG